MFRVLVQLANEGDVVDDATIHWPEDRTLMDLGRTTLTEPARDDAAQQRHLIFDPIPRVEGIEPSEDPLLELRAAVYLLWAATAGGRNRGCPGATSRGHGAADWRLPDRHPCFQGVTGAWSGYLPAMARFSFHEIATNVLMHSKVAANWFVDSLTRNIT